MCWEAVNRLVPRCATAVFSAVLATSAVAEEFSHITDILERGQHEPHVIAHQCAALFHTSIQFGENLMDAPTLDRYKTMRSTAQNVAKVSLEQKGLTGEELFMADTTGYLDKLNGYYQLFQEIAEQGQNPFANSNWQKDKNICGMLFDGKS